MPPMRRLVIAALLVTACGREPPRAPVAGREAPRGVPPVDPARMAAHPAGGAHGAPAMGDASTLVEGTIELGADVAATVKAGDVIFLTARPLDAAGAPGRTMAADRVEVGAAWPLRFQLTSAHRMSDAPMTGPALVVARVDRDGEAMTREPGDVEGSARVTLPATGLKIVLDTEVKP
jgi:hypothetical protein